MVPIPYAEMDSVDTHSDWRSLNGGYVVTNENPQIVSGLVQTAISKLSKRSRENPKAAGIAGGGDILLLGVLPHFKSLLGVDMGYSAIAATSVKVAMLALPTEKIKKLFKKDDNKAFVKAVDNEFAENVPRNLRERGFDSFLGIFNNYDGTCDGEPYGSMRNIWLPMPDEVIDQARRNLSGLRLEYGNLERVDGVYDVIYASNIFDSNWSGRKFTSLPTEVLNRLSRRGFLLSSSKVTHLDSHHAITYKMYDDDRWDYVLYRKK